MSKAQYQIADSHQTWLKIRSQGIGGSDVGTILGFNPFKTAYQLWLEKTGQLEAPDISGKVAIQIGHELEDLVARLFTQETGLKVQKDNKTYFHSKYSFLLGNIDRKIIGQKAFLECKTTSTFNAKEWQDDEVPASYLLQVQHYLNVLDYDTAYIAVIIGNNQFIWKEIKRDNDLIEQMTDRLVTFWRENVLKGIPPEIDGSNETKEALQVLYPTEIEETAPLDTKHIELLDKWSGIKAQAQELEELKKEIENKIRVYIGNEGVNQVYSDRFNASWKTQQRNSVDSKKLKEQYPDVYKEVLKSTTYKKLTIKELV